MHVVDARLAALAADPPAAVAADDCGGDAAMVISPRAPVAGERVRILAASDTGRIEDLLVSNVEGGVVSSDVRRLGGPPWSASVALADAASGTFRVEAMRDGRAVGCATFHVTGADERRRVVAAPSARGWDRATEALYSAWIEHLFDAPPDVALSFDTLQEVLTDPKRNLLHNHFGLARGRRSRRARRAPGLRRPALRAPRLLRVEARLADRVPSMQPRDGAHGSDVRRGEDRLAARGHRPAWLVRDASRPR